MSRHARLTPDPARAARWSDEEMVEVLVMLKHAIADLTMIENFYPSLFKNTEENDARADAALALFNKYADLLKAGAE